MKTMLSMPSTISSAVRVTSASQMSGLEIHSMTDQATQPVPSPHGNKREPQVRLYQGGTELSRVGERDCTRFRSGETFVPPRFTRTSGSACLSETPKGRARRRGPGFGGGGLGQLLTAAISNSMVTFSETRNPPASRAAFQLTPQSLRLTLVEPSSPMRV